MSIREALGSVRRASGKAVATSPDLERILALPRRMPEDHAELTEILRTPFGEQTLREVQARGLIEAVEQRGLLAVVRVGGGKTLLAFLLATVLDVDRPMLLVPSALVERTLRDLAELRKHWDIRVPHVMGYEMLSRPDRADELRRYNPDLIVADECHRLRFRSSAVTRRVERYIRDNPETIFCGLSGTVQGIKLSTYRHLTAWALGKGSPLPLDEKVCDVWDAALHPERGAHPNSPGILFDAFGHEPREGLGTWVRDTPGVVSTQAVGCVASIEISRWQAPKICRELLDAVSALEERPDGTPCTPAEASDVKCQLALGFWYRWDPPPPEEWLNERRDWCRFVREILEDPRNETLDSESQVADAYPDAAAQWLAVKPLYEPRVTPVWEHREAVLEADHWARSAGGIVWTRYSAFGHALGKSIPYYGQKGLDASGRHIEKAKGAIAASLRACGVGMNLQQYTDSLLVTPTPNPEIVEQLIGRTHREGQGADLIRLEWIKSIPYHSECLRRARDGASILEKQNGEPQKLTLATYL